MEREDRATRPRGAMRCSHKRIFRIIGRVREARARRAEKNDLHRGDFVLRPRFSRRRVKKRRSRRVVRGVRSAFTSTARDVRSSVDRRTHAVARVRTALPRSRTRLRLSARRSRLLVRAIHSRTVLVMSLASRSTPRRSPRAGSSAPVAVLESVRATPFPARPPRAARARPRGFSATRASPRPPLGALSFLPPAPKLALTLPLRMNLPSAASRVVANPARGRVPPSPAPPSRSSPASFRARRRWSRSTTSATSRA